MSLGYSSFRSSSSNSISSGGGGAWLVHSASSQPLACQVAALQSCRHQSMQCLVFVDCIAAIICGVLLSGRVSSYVSSKAGNDTLTSHVAGVMAKKEASEFGGEFDTPRSNLTGFSGRWRRMPVGKGSSVQKHPAKGPACAADRCFAVYAD